MALKAKSTVEGDGLAQYRANPDFALRTWVQQRTAMAGLGRQRRIENVGAMSEAAFLFQE
ncbi:MAG: hypothetical protein ABSD08_12305 [Xanthobacteraceae bacterium]|jgi:hypothetical protein